MADSLPSFLQFNRRRRGASDSDGVVTKLPGATTAADAAPPRRAPAVGFDPEAAVVPEPVAPPAAAAPTPMGPEVTGAERRGMGLAPLPVNARGETVGRPEYDDTGDRAADLENYRQGLAGQRNPEDRDGRWWTALKEAGRGFAQGGLMGAVFGGVRGAVSPNVNERRARDQEIGRVEVEQGKEAQRQGWRAKLAEAQADLDLKKSQAEYNRARPGIESERNDLRETIAREGFETRKSIAQMQDGTKRSEGAANRSSREGIAKMLDDFRKTKLYEDIKQRAADRSSRESEGAKNRASREAVAARAQAGADGRAAAGRASAEKRTLAGLRFKLMTLAEKAAKEGRSLEELVNEVETHGGEVMPDE